MVAIIGCDPGLDGALALIVDEKLIAIMDMPTLELDGKRRLTFDKRGMPVEKVSINRNVDPFGVRRVFYNWKEQVDGGTATLVIEKAWSRKGQAAPSMDKLLYGAGLVAGVAVGLGFQLKLVAPASWKASVGVSADKQTSLDLAKILVKDNQQWRGVFRRKQDNGRAEAFLIGLWGHRSLLK